MRHITLVTTGGTIEKTYDDMTGRLENRRSVVRRMLRRLRLVGTSVSVHELLHKDSLELTDDDRRSIVDAVRQAAGPRENPTDCTGIVVLHGTDTLHTTGEVLYQSIPEPRIPIVLTGAMRPFEMLHSDALQNLTESIFAAGMLPPGIYCVAHGRALQFPGVVKDRHQRTFIKPQAGTHDHGDPG